MHNIRHPHPPELISYFQGSGVRTYGQTGKENIWGVLWAAPQLGVGGVIGSSITSLVAGGLGLVGSAQGARIL